MSLTRCRSAAARVKAGDTPLALWARFVSACGVSTFASLVVIRPRVQDIETLLLLAAATITAVVAGVRLLGPRSRAAAYLPIVLSLLALGVTGPLTEGLAPALGGLYVVGFVFVGVTQPRWTTAKLVPLAAGCWLLTNVPVERTTLARLPVAIGIWLLVGELLSNITSRGEQDRASLAEQASLDALTGLANRHDLDARLAALSPGDAVVFLDLDHFKAVNDTFGHQVGDRVLADLGRVVLAVLRPRDTAVRYGGEEILLLLPGAGHDGADRCLERMRIGWSASHPELTFSAGVGVIVAGEPARMAVKRADDALYDAKARGRNRTRHRQESPASSLAIA